MADEDETEVEEPKKKSKLPMILGVVLALSLGGGGFFAVYSGLILAPAPAEVFEEHCGFCFAFPGRFGRSSGTMMNSSRMPWRDSAGIRALCPWRQLGFAGFPGSCMSRT